MPRLRHLLAVALGLAAAAVPAGAHAQSLSQVSTRAHISGGGGCSDRGGASAAAACALDGANGRVTASVDARGLHAGAWLDRTGSVTGHERATGYAYMFDRLTFGSVSPFALRFSLRLHGRVVGDASFGTMFGGSSAGEPQGAVTLRNTNGLWRTVSGVFETPVAGGVVDFSIWLETNARFQYADAGSGCSVTCDGNVYADFSNTGWIEQIEGLDANGDVITSGLVARSASGTAYTLVGGTVVTTTPEPGSLALMAAGGLALVAAGRRRLRAAA